MMIEITAVPQAAAKPVLHIEVRLQQSSRIRPDSITRFIEKWLIQNCITLALGSELKEEISRKIIHNATAQLRQEKYQLIETGDSPLIHDNVESITVAEATGSKTIAEALSLEEVDLAIHPYRLHYKSPPDTEEPEETANSLEPEYPTARVLDLPASSLDGLWEFLIFDPDVKTKMLNYISSVLLFSDKKVNTHCVSFNRLILFHGPPGTGKTSLCRALAQKLSIRLSQRYSRSRLVEINSHSLFSKWFSESGKLVGRMFDDILSMLLDEDSFIFVLIDEVESLTSARKAMASGNEPTDSLRVVNALLTALDKLRNKKNVIILTTSNLPEAMDAAFIDRVDMKQYVGSPTLQASYAILRTCLNELMRCEIIESEEGEIPAFTVASILLCSEPDGLSTKLYKIANNCAAARLSARALKKLPLLMHASWIQKEKCSLGHALEALEIAVQEEKLSLIPG